MFSTLTALASFHPKEFAPEKFNVAPLFTVTVPRIVPCPYVVIPPRVNVPALTVVPPV